MTTHSTISAADLYAQIVDGVVAEPELQKGLLADFNGTVAKRFGVTLPSAGQLTHSGSGFRLSYGGQDYDLGDPRAAKPGELNDAELELVSGGSQELCPQSADPNANRKAENATNFITRV